MPNNFNLNDFRSAVEIKKTFSISTAHILEENSSYTVNCQQLHGHQYKVTLAICRCNLDTDENGMVIDFTKLKEVFDKYVHDFYDHAAIIPQSRTGLFNEICGRIRVIDFNPTAENIGRDILKRMNEGFAKEGLDDIFCNSVIISETENNDAIVYVIPNNC
jgi:queuosine biosynthesis protein QueD